MHQTGNRAIFLHFLWKNFFNKKSESLKGNETGEKGKSGTKKHLYLDNE